MPGGETTEIDVSDWTSNSVAGIWPKRTPVAPVKVEPGDRQQCAAGRRALFRRELFHDRHDARVEVGELLVGAGGGGAVGGADGDAHGPCPGGETAVTEVEDCTPKL